MSNTTLISKNKTFLSLHVQLTNITVLKSTHEGNLQLTVLPEESTKEHVLPPTTFGALILVA